MNIDTHKQRRGFTLVELVIAFTVLSLILGAIGMVNLAGRDAYQQGVQSATLEARARRTLQRIAHELTAGLAMRLTPVPNTAAMNQAGVSTIQFTTCEGFAAGLTLESTPTGIVYESDPNDADDGFDNDSDGLVDERQVVLVRNRGLANEVRTVLAGNVAELLEGETLNLADDNGNALVDEPGFSVTEEADSDVITGRTLRLRLTLQGRDPKNRLVNRTVETSVHMRN